MLVRLAEIELKSFKNIIRGNIKMPSQIKKTEDNADIVGIYGQNGSGKTAVIDALSFLKLIMTSSPLPDNMSDYITKSENNANLYFGFNIESDEKEYFVQYRISIGDKQIDNESLAIYERADGKKKRIDYIECSIDDSDSIFKPKKRWNAFTSVNKRSRIDIEVEKRLCLRDRRSVLFSEEIANIIFSDESLIAEAVKALKKFAAFGLFIVHGDEYSTHDSMELVLPKKEAIEKYGISLTEPTVMDCEKYGKFMSAIGNMNILMQAIVPGFSVETRELGTELLRDGEQGMRFELLSRRGDMLVPIRYESEGIKKLLSIINLLIAMYNNYSVCVVVDEMDAGVFEFLLGELLSCIEENGKGQLIFTSHNLRPLEMINREALVFTTTNPNNRYIRIGEKHGNLRSSYLRHILLGGLPEKIYEDTNTFEIASAFRRCREK